MNNHSVVQNRHEIREGESRREAGPSRPGNPPPLNPSGFGLLRDLGYGVLYLQQLYLLHRIFHFHFIAFPALLTRV
jgi:hypothetical protein